MAHGKHSLPKSSEHHGPAHRLEWQPRRALDGKVMGIGSALLSLVVVPVALIAASDKLRERDARAAAVARQPEDIAQPDGVDDGRQNRPAMPSAVPEVSPSNIPKLEIPRTAEQAKAEQGLAAAVQESAKTAIKFAAQNPDLATIEAMPLPNGATAYTIERSSGTDPLDGVAKIQLSFTAPASEAGDPDLRQAPTSFSIASTDAGTGLVSRVSYDVINGSVVASSTVNGELAQAETSDGTLVPLQYGTTQPNSGPDFIVGGIKQDVAMQTAGLVAPPAAETSSPPLPPTPPILA